MTIKDYRSLFIENLALLYDVMEAESFFYLILQEKKQLKRINLALNPALEFSEPEISEWNEIIEKLKLQIPIQHILGKSHFFGLDFIVNQNVLIPRPETEELVDWIIKDNEFKSDLKILDIGTGSGCIAISLAKNLPSAEVYAIDISEKALETARMNAASNNVKVNIIQKNILETEDLNEKFDVIVSNPPYVRYLEQEEMKGNVLDNEPHLALFVENDDALIFYRKIAELAQKNLTTDGILYFEINQYLGEEMLELLNNKGFKNAELRKDIYGNDRMTKATL